MLWRSGAGDGRVASLGGGVGSLSADHKLIVASSRELTASGLAMSWWWAGDYGSSGGNATLRGGRRVPFQAIACVAMLLANLTKARLSLSCARWL